MIRLSVFTPTHNPRHLDDCFVSLLGQTYPNWEWVIVPNNSVSLPAHIAQHPRVRVVPFTESTNSIGALKRFACDACDGEVFVELDHDDMLLPRTLEKVAVASQDAGFVYSDAAIFQDVSLTPVVFSEHFGWETYPVDAFGTSFVATASFPLTARSLCEIFYAPDHVRAWRRDAYKASGGHDPNLPVGDDHDLVCRTYLAGVAFQHIGGCGYLYRTHADNTVFTRNNQIQEQQSRNCGNYIDHLINEWCRREGLPVVNLGELIEMCLHPQAVLSILGTIQDSAIGRVTGIDLLQRFSSVEAVALFNEAYRILVPGGWFHLSVPSTDGRGAFQDLRHCTFWNENSWLYFTRAELARHYPNLTARFQCVRSSTEFPSVWHQQFNIPCTSAYFSAVKGQRQPGAVLI
jgi:glycosyltransferase involved in cell wall biosynthesis